MCQPIIFVKIQKIMKYNEVLDKYTFIPEKALDCGFSEKDGIYSLKRYLCNRDFYTVIEISRDNINAEVFESEDDELYIPFNVSIDDGGFVNEIRAEVQGIIDEFIKKCFTVCDVKTALINFAGERFKTTPEAPWDYLDEYHTLKTENKKKWYALFMYIPYKYLGVDKKGKIHVLNVKASSDTINNVIDNVHYFPAYHMNKKYWISILLDKTADVQFIEKLIEESYYLAEGKKR